jgi:formiminotetrahydrofolate cyclodeaminase
MLADRPLTALLDAFSSPDPTPGGGSAAALAGALGASLLAMVAGMTRTKTGTPEDRAALDGARAKLLAARDALVALIDRDAQAYDLVVAAYKRPKGTEADKVARAAAIQEALGAATAVPLQTLQTCLQAMEVAGTIAERGNPSAISDVIVGYSSLGQGVQGALLNVEINLGSITNAAHVEAITRELRGASAAMHESARAVYSTAAAQDLMLKAGQRAGSAHGRPPFEPGTDQFKSAMATGAAHGLLHLDTPEAREALDRLVASADPIVAQRVREVIARKT